MNEKQLQKHQQEHTAEAIQQRLLTEDKGHYLKDALLGAMDGCVTCFALICGIQGAGYSYSVAIILGLASLFADGFSMAVSNYFSTKSEVDKIKQITKKEEHHINIYPEGEKEEVRQIFKQKGFEGEVLDKIVETITQDKENWIKTMLTEEYGLSLKTVKPFMSAWITMLAFIIIGVIPLLPMMFSTHLNELPFTIIVIFTAIAFCAIGIVKGVVIRENLAISVIEALAIGAVAAVMAYSISYLLKNYIIAA